MLPRPRPLAISLFSAIALSDPAHAEESPLPGLRLEPGRELVLAGSMRVEARGATECSGDWTLDSRWLALGTGDPLAPPSSPGADAGWTFLTRESAHHARHEGTGCSTSGKTYIGSDTFHPGSTVIRRRPPSSAPFKVSSGWSPLNPYVAADATRRTDKKDSVEVVPGSYVSTLWQRSVEQGEKGSVVVTVLGASPVPFDAHPEATLLSFRDAVEVEPATGSLVGWSRSTTWRVQEGPGKVAEWSLTMTLAPTSQGTLDAATVQSIREGYKELDTLRALAKSDSGAALLRARAAAPRYFGTMLEERFRRRIQSLEEGDRQERPKSGQPVEGAHL